MSKNSSQGSTTKSVMLVSGSVFPQSGSDQGAVKSFSKAHYNDVLAWFRENTTNVCAYGTEEISGTLSNGRTLSVSLAWTRHDIEI